MGRTEIARGMSELRAARAGCRGLLAAAVVFSVFINLLMLTPAVAMQFTDEVNWTVGDFIFAALMFGSVGLAVVTTTALLWPCGGGSKVTRAWGAQATRPAAITAAITSSLLIRMPPWNTPSRMKIGSLGMPMSIL